LSVWYKHFLLHIILKLIIVHSADAFVQCQMLLIVHSRNSTFGWAAGHRLWYCSYWAARLRLWYCLYCAAGLKLWYCLYWAAGLRLCYCHNGYIYICTFIWGTRGNSILCSWICCAYSLCDFRFFLTFFFLNHTTPWAPQKFLRTSIHSVLWRRRIIKWFVECLKTCCFLCSCYLCIWTVSDESFFNSKVDKDFKNPTVRKIGIGPLYDYIFIRPLYDKVILMLVGGGLDCWSVIPYLYNVNFTRVSCIFVSIHKVYILKI
jgi:hypothetical protein